MLLIIATHIHFLVGAYSFFYIILTLFLYRKSNNITLRELIVGGVIYSVVLLPFVIYLKTSSLDYDSVNNEISSDWIYTYYRVPHHTALVKSFAHFCKTHLIGVAQAFIALMAAILFYNLNKQKHIQLITQFVIVSLAGTLLLVSVSFIDRSGFILKFYLYRINTLSTFFVSLLVVVWIYSLCRNEYLYYFKKGILLFCLPLFIYPVGMNIYKNIENLFKKDLDEMCHYIKLNTSRDALLFTFTEDLSISRKTERNRLVIHKFAPAQINKIYGWYTKYLDRLKMLDNPDDLLKGIEKYGVNYLLAPNDQSISNHYKLIRRNNGYSLYKTHMPSSLTIDNASI